MLAYNKRKVGGKKKKTKRENPKAKFANPKQKRWLAASCLVVDVAEEEEEVRTSLWMLKTCAALKGGGSVLEKGVRLTWGNLG